MEDKNEVIKKMKHSLLDMAFNDILRASGGGSKMGAFILASCFIDYLTGFYCGEKANGKHYKSFVRDFLPKYDPDKLYHDLRCGLVHNYSVGQSYVFTDANKGGTHFETTMKGLVILNLEDFLNDLERAVHDYFKLLENDPKIFDKAYRRLKKFGILTVGPIEKF